VVAPLSSPLPKKLDKETEKIPNFPLLLEIKPVNAIEDKVMADSDPTKSPLNAAAVAGTEGKVVGQYDVSQQARKKAAKNDNSTQSPLAAG
jgi:hypothetical protein|tara:strand:- start:6585 stop:6857 length:273 start_codon:yes stop_codon:yes gene_type:complete